MPRTLVEKIPSLAYLWTANIIFAASASVTRKLTEIGEHHLVNGTSPISNCNVLFVGNICAFAVMSAVFYRRENWQIKQLTLSNWIGLTAIGILSGAVGPALIFAALDNTTVTNVVLIGRIEPPLTLALSYLLLKTRVNIWTIAGSLLSFAGVVTTAFLTNASIRQPSPDMMGGLYGIGKGELQTAAGALVLAIATVISKSHLQSISLGIFSLYRTFLGTIVFFFLAHYFYGPGHFAEVLSPFLWLWMLVYGAVIVVIGQLCWFAGLKNSTNREVAVASSFNPIAAIAIAYLILGEVPTMAQYLGGSIILAGIFLTLFDNFSQVKTKISSTRFAIAKHMEMANGFRGT